MRDDDPGPGWSALSDELGPTYLGDGRQAFLAATVAGWAEKNRSAMTVHLFTAEQVAARVAAERERCAGICDTIYAIDSAHAAKVCAAAIRGRIGEHCPFPWTGDNGSVWQCKERGHCGCGA